MIPGVSRLLAISAVVAVLSVLVPLGPAVAAAPRPLRHGVARGWPTTRAAVRSCCSGVRHGLPRRTPGPAKEDWTKYEALRSRSPAGIEFGGAKSHAYQIRVL